MQVADGVINLKAEYGVDADDDGRIDDRPSGRPSAPADWTPACSRSASPCWCAAASSSAAAIPAASGVPAGHADGDNPYYFGDTLAARSVMTNVDGNADTFDDLTADPNNWRYYRYRVYERVIPLRNMLWGTCA